MSEVQGQEPISDLERRIRQANELAEQRQAEEDQRRTEAEQRRAKAGRQVQVLNLIVDNLNTRIMGLFPRCKPSHGRNGWAWCLGDAVLSVEPPQVVEHPNVLVYSSIAMKCGGRGYRNWSHSLWCYEVGQEWCERGFVLSDKRGDQERFALNPNAHRRADRHKYRWHSEPLEADKFIERWIGWFADAARGSLEPMPPWST